MFDTMTLTKAVGSICAALLILLLGVWAANGLFNVGGGHGEDHLAGYVIDTGENEAAGEDVVEEVAFSEILAAADPADGEGLWRQCRACHVVDPGVHGVGPSLHGVVGRDIASAEGYSYSSALLALEGGWTPEALNAWLENPRGYAQGTAMSYGGMRSVEDRAAMIAYLDSLDE
ncbi:MAG: cytochrome c family protein [Rhodobacteraceae bacterium CG17_big_fil_post_rev_8_21_14_2_50_65_11]|nr:MAG: cytochrome c family protein [Rhodobacteraceae bacterium CG17_big_fil_post_rev_8_21_14_2_50_65_11]